MSSKVPPGGWEIMPGGHWVEHEYDQLEPGTTRCGRPWPFDLRMVPCFEVDPCLLCASGIRWAEQMPAHAEERLREAIFGDEEVP